MRRLSLLLSFDHELSLGGTDCYHRNLFEPTEQILELASELNAPVTLFTDILSAVRFEQWDFEGYYRPYTEQLQRALAAGHDVQLHLHPHWLDSEFRDGEFIPAKTFALGDFLHRQSPLDIPGIVQLGVHRLNEICLAVTPEYACVAFRAGGLVMAPATSEILTARACVPR